MYKAQTQGHVFVSVGYKTQELSHAHDTKPNLVGNLITYL